MPLICTMRHPTSGAGADASCSGQTSRLGRRASTHCGCIFQASSKRGRPSSSIALTVSTTALCSSQCCSHCTTTSGAAVKRSLGRSTLLPHCSCFNCTRFYRNLNLECVCAKCILSHILGWYCHCHCSQDSENSRSWAGPLFQWMQNSGQRFRRVGCS